MPWRLPGIERRAGQQRCQAAAFAAAARAQSRELYPQAEGSGGWPGPGPYREHMRSKQRANGKGKATEGRDRCAAHTPARTHTEEGALPSGIAL